MSIKVSYKGKTVGEYSGSKSFVLPTRGKYCEDDIKIRLSCDVSNYLWSQCPKNVKNFIKNVTYNENDYSVSYIENYAPAVPNKENMSPICALNNSKSHNYTPLEFTSVFGIDITDRFMPVDSLHLIKTNAKNVRDLGGYTVEGGTVQYGRLFRGGEITDLDRKTLVEELKVVFEVNLRGDETANDESVLGDDVYFYRPPLFRAYTLDNPYLMETISRIITAVIHNETVYFHCSLGADRTGTLAFILEEIIGMNQSDIDKDYELTMFYTTAIKRTRSTENAYKKLVDEVKLLPGNTMEQKVINYLLENGETIKRINRFREKMTKGTPSKWYKIDKNLTNCVDNGNIIATKDSFETTLIPSEGYTLSGASVEVLMDGIDITESAYKRRKVSIENVTGDVVINISALPISEIDTNKIPESTDKSGNIFNSIGYKNGYRINNYGNETEAEGAVCTGFIPVSSGTIVEFINEYIGNSGGSECSFFYDENKDMIGDYRITPYFLKQNAGNEQMEIYSPYIYDSNLKRLKEFTVPADNRIAYVRFTLHASSGENAIIITEEPS